jgi:hypothetical protein
VPDISKAQRKPAVSDFPVLFARGKVVDLPAAHRLFGLREAIMNLFKTMIFAAALAIAGYVCMQQPAIAAQAISMPPVLSSATKQMIPEAYYYYRGRRYPYRYHGMYFNHRYYRNNRWHYY